MDYILQNFGFYYHYTAFTRGLVDTQDAAYFASGANFASAARIRCQSAKLVTLPKQALLTVTLKGAASAKAADIDILIYGEKFGQL